MKNVILALTAAVALGVAAPASAFSVQFDLPNLTFPPEPATPDVSMACVDTTLATSAGCVSDS